MLLIQKGVDVPHGTLASKTLFLTASLVAFILFTYYVGDLTAIMTSRPPPLQLRGFKDVLDAGYKVSVLKGSTFYTWFQEAKPGTAMHEVFLQMLENPDILADTYADSWNMFKVCANGCKIINNSGTLE